MHLIVQDWIQDYSHLLIYLFLVINDADFWLAGFFFQSCGILEWVSNCFIVRVEGIVLDDSI